MSRTSTGKATWFAAVLIAVCSGPVFAQKAPNAPVFVRSSDGQLVPMCGGHVCSPEELAPKPQKPDVDLNHSFQTPPPNQEQAQATSVHTFDHALDKIAPQSTMPAFQIQLPGAFIIVPPEPFTTALPDSPAAKPAVQAAIPPTDAPAPRFEPLITPHASEPILPNARSCNGPTPSGAGALWGINCAMHRNREQANERRAQQAEQQQLDAEKRELQAEERAADDQYTREALQELLKDRDTATSLKPLLHDQTYGRRAADAYYNLASAYRGVRQSVCALHPEMQVPDIDGTPKPCK